MFFFVGDHHETTGAEARLAGLKFPRSLKGKSAAVKRTRSSAVTGRPLRLVPTTIRASLAFMSSRPSARARMAMISLATAMSKPVWRGGKKHTKKIESTPKGLKVTGERTTNHKEANFATC